VVVGTLANGATYQSEEASIPLIGNFSITNVIPTGYSSTLGDRTLQINFPVTSVGGSTYTVSYKLATDVNYTSVPGSFTSSPITLDFSSTGLNLYPNAMYMFQVTASNSTGTKSNTVSVTSNTPWYYKIPSPIGTGEYNGYYINSQGNLYGWGINSSNSLLNASSPQMAPYNLSTAANGMTSGNAITALATTSGLYLLETGLSLNSVGGIAGRGLGYFGSIGPVVAKLTPNPVSASNTPSNSYTARSSGSVTSTFSNTASNTPSGAPLSTLSNITRLTASSTSACAIDLNQKAWCWGSNGYGQLQAGDTTDTQYWATQVPDNHNYLTIGVGEYHACALDTSHTVWCWGRGDDGEAGGSSFATINTTANSITDGNGNVITDFIDLSVGFRTNCGIRSDGSVWCWGAFYSQALGSSSGDTYNAIPATTFSTNDAVSMTSGNYFSCVLRRNGSLWCWGNNQYGQLGQPNSLISSSTSYQIQTWTDVRVAFSNSESLHACAIRQDSGTDSLWCWGRNDSSQLGAGNASSATPGFTPSASNTPTSSSSGTISFSPTTTPTGGISPTSTSTVLPSPTAGLSHTPSATSSITPSNTGTSNPSTITTNYQYTPQYVNVPVM
jgi:hypothetical protein